MEETIPEDVLAAASKALAQYMDSRVELVISRAIMAERERCAEVADVAADEQDVLALSADESHFAGYRQGERVAKSIATSIRSGV